jgi:hypothetical protein
MPQTKEDLLGKLTKPGEVVPMSAEPFNPSETLDFIRFNEDFKSVPCYCSRCGITAYIPESEAQTLLELYGKSETFPPYRVGIYIENNGCPRCLQKRGEAPVVKTFEVK